MGTGLGTGSAASRGASMIGPDSTCSSASTVTTPGGAAFGGAAVTSPALIRSSRSCRAGGGPVVASRTAMSPPEPAPGPNGSPRTSRAPGRAARRSAGESGVVPSRLSAMLAATVGGRPTAAAPPAAAAAACVAPGTTRACTGALIVSSWPVVTWRSGSRWVAWYTNPTSRATCAARIRRFASSTSPSWSQDACMNSSSCSRTTRPPVPAGTRNRGSRFSSCTQLSFGVTGVPSRLVSSRDASACHRPYRGGVTSGSGSVPATPCTW
ncbi:MAG: hypothetical protein E6F99_30635 [Actinobacteria bacterium]|nr:MAG: hypothetical protein E6F99_30635 [Actinomycetota bacterium]